MPRIKEISIKRVNLKLTRPYTIAFKTVDKVENAIVSVTLDNGLVGLGAANPSEQVVGENLDHTMEVLNAVQNNSEYAWNGLLGREIDDIEVICQEIQRHLSHSPSARSALEIALFDVYALQKKVPLVSLLGQAFESLPTSITIGIKGVQDTIEEAREYLDRGFSYLKVKLGNDLEEDIERVIKLREQFGGGIKIRVDANQGYNSEDLLLFYQRTALYDLELIEQPLAAKEVEALRSLPWNIRQVVAADESLVNPGDARLLAGEDPTCGIFNIKLMKCGGITPAMDIAEIAKGSNIDLMWGCNDESVISITAALHTALACNNTRYIDLDGSLDLAEDVASEGFIIENGVMRTNGKPGLGLDNHLYN